MEIQQQTNNDLFLVSSPADHDGHADCVVQLYGEYIAYNDALDWLYYSPAERYWKRENARAAIDRLITATLRLRNEAAKKVGNERLDKKTACDRANIDGTRALLQTKREIIKPVGEFDSETHLLNCRNGVVNLRTGKILPHSTDDRFTYCIEADYDEDENANQTVFTDFLATLEFSSEKLDFLQRALGYAITGETSEEVMFYLHGVTRSGKGVIMQSVLDLLGHPLAIGTNFSTFTANRDNDNNNFDLAPLKPARLVSASESRRNQILNDALLKQITGRDPVNCSHKFREQFTYIPRYKLFLTSNHQIRLPPDEPAAWTRVKVIEFTKSFLGSEDKNLKARLMSEQGKTALLAWLVRGAIEWYKFGLPLCEEVEKATELQREKSDTVGEFLREFYTVDKMMDAGRYVYAVLMSEIYNEYRQWCIAEGYMEQKRPRVREYLENVLKLEIINGTRNSINGQYVFGIARKAGVNIL